jgi:hypothetical protein
MRRGTILFFLVAHVEGCRADFSDMPFQNSDVIVGLQHVLGVKSVGAFSYVRRARKAGSFSIEAVMPVLLVALDMAIPFFSFATSFVT